MIGDTILGRNLRKPPFVQRLLQWVNRSQPTTPVIEGKNMEIVRMLRAEARKHEDAATAPVPAHGRFTGV